MKSYILCSKRPCLLAATILVLTISVWADSVKSDYDHNANFSQIHTYSWGQVKTADPLYADRIKQQVNQDLQSKGWKMVSSGGDATIFATENIHNQQELQTTYDSFGPGWGGGWGWGGWGWGGGGGFGESTTRPINQEIGSLIIDMFSSDKKIIWRGMIQGDVSGNPSKNTKNMDRDIDKLFRDFPPRNKS